MGRTAEAADDARRALALAREIGLPGRGSDSPGRPQPSTPTMPAIMTSAVRLARQAGQITAGVPGWLARYAQLCAD